MDAVLVYLLTGFFFFYFETQSVSSAEDSLLLNYFLIHFNVVD